MIMFVWSIAILTLTSSSLFSTPSSQEPNILELLTQSNLRIIVMRHGEALHNLKHLMTSTKSPGIYLTEKGIDQVQNSAIQLFQERVDCIYVSPVYRTMQTAQIVGQILQIPYRKILVEEDLREQYFGTFEDHTYHEYEAYFSESGDEFIYAVPGGESGAELFFRTNEFLSRIAKNHQNETILLVTHGYNCCQISKCLTGSYAAVPEKAEYQIYDFTNETTDEVD